ncbi:MAG TPA: tetratricopeptide repeat protein, partial [Ktedonobacteraceae bacterium]|nr:tetratricopeptide repeat protein [Ktedonobacteraceae bacterium]
KQALGESHPDVATPLTHLADLFVRQGKYEQAEALYRRALRIRQLALGESHPLVITVLSSLATLSQRQKNYLEAELLSQ